MLLMYVEMFAWLELSDGAMVGCTPPIQDARLALGVRCTSCCTFKGVVEVPLSSRSELTPWGISDICVGRVPLGLDPGRAGNLPWAGSDGSLLAGGGSITVWVLYATAGTSGILSAHLLS